MQNIIKKIRAELDMSQTEFADKLGVTFASVNRWENGKAFPNKIAQVNIYNLCKEKNVPLFNMVLERIAEEANSIKLENDRVLLYHGSKSGIEGEIIPGSRKQCDFGKGFYMGTEAMQALTLICNFPKSRFYVVSVDKKDLDVLDVPADLDWALLVAFNRGKMKNISGTEFYNKYRDMTANKDLVIGYIANDRMFYVIDQFFQGTITDAALINSLSVLNLGKQYVTVSEKGCKAVRIEKEIAISQLERMAISDIAASNREKGISDANEICKNYRRKGFFFDEILEKAKSGGET